MAKKLVGLPNVQASESCKPPFPFSHPGSHGSQCDSHGSQRNSHGLLACTLVRLEISHVPFYSQRNRAVLPLTVFENSPMSTF